MKSAVVPVATMLAIQAMISLCVLALGVMMPAVAKDLAIDPKLVGIFTAINSLGYATGPWVMGYLFDRDDAKKAFRRAAGIAHANGRKVSLTLSDSFCVDRHRDDFAALVRD